MYCRHGSGYFEHLADTPFRTAHMTYMIPDFNRHCFLLSCVNLTHVLVLGEKLPHQIIVKIHLYLDSTITDMIQPMLIESKVSLCLLPIQ